MADAKRSIRGHTIRRSATQMDRLERHGLLNLPGEGVKPEGGVEGVSDRQQVSEPESASEPSNGS